MKNMKKLTSILLGTLVVCLGLGIGMMQIELEDPPLRGSNNINWVG
jgi:hypothetical protein